MGLRDWLFRRSSASSNKSTFPDDVRPELMTAVEEAIVTILVENFLMMGVEPQSVATTGSTGDLRSRGYLLGLTEAVILQFQALNPTQAEFVTALASTFAATYGPCDWPWALSTVDQFQADNPDVLMGCKLAYRDVRAVYSGQAFAAPTGFWLLNSGDEEAIRYNLAQL